ncbi:MAG: nodulation protein NfeD [Thermodesulfobacteriota bacterium]|nr:nodulation protein NfeD [Thermodesulfobacteriota bacterium]
MTFKNHLVIVFFVFTAITGIISLRDAIPTKRLHVNVARVNSIINPVVSEFIIESIDRSLLEKAECLIIQLDTPGGLDLSMRDIVKAILNSDIPIIVYVAPSGARAASAGVMITLASNIAVMAPGTNIGAAHPVALGGKNIDEEMEKKVVNDAVAYIKSIANKRGRNAKWAEKAVKKSVSITEKEALNLKVIDLIAPDIETLLEQIDQREVTTSGGTFTLHTKGVQPVYINMGFRHNILNVLSNPNIAYILMMLGLLGLYFEMAHPGVIFPGVIGGICLILSFFAFQTLPINYAGILLILLAIILFIAEVKVTSFGLLTIGGIISMFLGSIMLFESPIPYLRVSWSVLIPVVLATSALFILSAALALKAYLAKPSTGMEGLIGEIGIAKTEISNNGKVFIHGEYWNAYSNNVVPQGERVRVVGIEKLRLNVEKLE